MIATAGNDEVIAALSTMLAEARKGKACFLIATMVDVAGTALLGGWFGAGTHERVCMDKLEQLCHRMDLNLINRTLPERDPAVPADRVCCNIAAGFGLSFDFVPWLIDAEMERVRQGAPAPLKVGFWLGRDGKTGLETEAQQQLFRNIVQPTLALFGAVEDPTAVDGRFREQWTTNVICEAARRGEPIPRVRVPTHAAAVIDQWLGTPGVFGSNPVTITLRELDRDPQRNSNLVAWHRFARYLRSRGENVVIVRDTAKADAPFYRDGYEYRTCPRASTNLQIRAALYECAKVNLFVANGPAALALFGSRPWLCFTEIFDDDHAHLPSTRSFWRSAIGVEPGEQYPWSQPDQRIVWAKDNYDNIVAAWEALRPPIAIAS